MNESTQALLAKQTDDTSSSPQVAPNPGEVSRDECIEAALSALQAAPAMVRRAHYSTEALAALRALLSSCKMATARPHQASDISAIEHLLNSLDTVAAATQRKLEGVAKGWDNPALQYLLELGEHSEIRSLHPWKAWLLLEAVREHQGHVYALSYDDVFERSWCLWWNDDAGSTHCTKFEMPSHVGYGRAERLALKHS